MSSATLNTPEGRLSMHVDVVDVPSLMGGPDHSWTYTDKMGHDHYYDGYPVPYPTLVEISTGAYWCQDCRDEHDRSHLECRICGEEIQPAMRGGSPFVERVPGRRWFELDGVEISEARFTELLERYYQPGE